MEEGVSFRILQARFALVQLPKGTELPVCPPGVEFWSITETADEISVICPESEVPVRPGLAVERAWRGIKVAGPLAFELKGILASLLVPLASAKICVFTLSTYDTDYIFVKDFDLDPTVQALVAAGHRLD